MGPVMSKQTLANCLAYDCLLTLCYEFPGIYDGETEVNGADLVEALSALLARPTTLRSQLAKDLPS